MSIVGPLPADVGADAPAALATLLPLVGHTLHWTLTGGGLLALLVLLAAARPGRAAPVRRPADVRRRQLELLATATPLVATGPVTAAPRPSVPAPDRRAPRPAGAAERTWLPVALVSSAAAAGVHAAAGPTHLAEGLLVGGFFVVSALAQLGWAAAVLVRGPTRALLVAALVGNVAVVALWLTTRTVGLPGGLAAVEPVGPWDLAATAWELAVVGGVSLVLGSVCFADNRATRLDIVRWSVAARVWLLASVTLMAVLTVAGTSGQVALGG